MYKTPAHEICDNLGFTPEEAQASAESVAARIDRVDNWSEAKTTAVLGGQTRIHLHQIATDSDGNTWIVLGLNDDTVELTQVRGTKNRGDVVFMDERTVSHGEFIMNYQVQTEESLDSRFSEPDTVPVWGY